LQDVNTQQHEREMLLPQFLDPLFEGFAGSHMWRIFPATIREVR
jgi:hypothetical protein